MLNFYNIFLPLQTSGPYDIKEATEAWRSLAAAQPGACFPYDPTMSVYPYGPGQVLFNFQKLKKNTFKKSREKTLDKNAHGEIGCLLSIF